MADYVPKLGEFPGPGDTRDAIHVAVIPVRAGETLSPGSWVHMKDDRAYEVIPPRAIGVVDPYLVNAWVQPGQAFWLCLKPQTITGLRHRWSHPAFADVSEELPSKEDVFAEAQKVVEHVAERRGVTTNELMAAADRYVFMDEMTDDRFKEDDNSTGEWHEFWKAWALLTGQAPPTSMSTPYTCCA